MYFEGLNGGLGNLWLQLKLSKTDDCRQIHSDLEQPSIDLILISRLSHHSLLWWYWFEPEVVAPGLNVLSGRPKGPNMVALEYNYAGFIVAVSCYLGRKTFEVRD